MARLKELHELMAGLNGQARSVLAKAKSEKREITKEEGERIDALYAEYDQLEAEAKQLEANERRAQRADEIDAYLDGSRGRRTEPNPVNGGGRTEPTVIELHNRRLEFAPNSRQAQAATPEYAAMIASYLLTGQVQAGLLTADNTRGGYLTTTQMAAGLLKALDNRVFMRQRGTVHPPLTMATSLGIMSLDADPADADWTPEVPASAITEDDSMRFGRREMTPHLDTKLIKISMKLLRAALINVESIVAERLAYKHGVTEEQAFMTGSGVERPLGIFVASNDGIPTTQDVTCASQTEFTADELMDLVYSIKSGYMANATWCFNRGFLKRARKLKDGNGQYLWQPGLQGSPGTLLDRPYELSEYAPNTFTTGQYVAAFGDLSYYHIVDSLQIELQRANDLGAPTNQVFLFSRKETDGMPVLAEAFARLKLG